MFKSKVVAYVKPSSSCKVVLIWRIGYGLHTMRLLSSLKSDMVCTVWSFLGIMKYGKAHLDSGCHFSVLSLPGNQSLFKRVDLCIFVIGYGLLWYGLAPSFSSKETGGYFKSSSMPSKSSSYLRSNESSKFWCGVLRCTKLFLRMLGRSALLHLASKISTTRLVALHVFSGSWVELEINSSALEMLDLSCRLLMFLMSKRMSSLVMVHSFEVQHCTYIMKSLLASTGAPFSLWNCWQRRA